MFLSALPEIQSRSDWAFCAYGGGENAASLLLINSRNMSGAPGGAGDVTPAEPGWNVASDTCAARITAPGSQDYEATGLRRAEPRSYCRLRWHHM